MAHKIEKFDLGYVSANSTWHNQPQFKCLGEGAEITINQCREVLDYEIVKEPLFRFEGVPGHHDKVEGAFCIVRPDHNIVLAAHVGTRYTAENNVAILDQVDRWLLPQYPDLKVDSVGTFCNGATAFLSLKVSEFTVRGDESPTATHLMYINPIGVGCIQSCVNSIRIVCRNTARMALRQGAANGSMQRFAHTSGAPTRVANAMVDMAEVFLGLKKMEDTLNELAEQSVDTKYVESFLEAFFPRNSAKESVLALFEGDQALTGQVKTSKYALYNAVTDHLDHNTTIRGGDQAGTMWDGITGLRAAKKEQVLQHLLTV